MAKKEESSKTVLERIYNIPLRRETLKVPPFRKANKAVRTVKIFISKHMKSDNVVLGKYLNLRIWRHGAKNPPHHVKVNAAKDDKGKVFVEIVDAPKQKPKVEEKKEEAKKDEKVVKEAEFKVHERSPAPASLEKPAEKLEKQAEEGLSEAKPSNFSSTFLHGKKVEEIKKIKDEKAEEAKKQEEEELKELKKEHPKIHTPKMPKKPKLQEARPPAPLQR